MGAQRCSTHHPHPSGGGPGEGCFPISDLCWRFAQPDSQPPSAVWGVLKRALKGQSCQIGGEAVSPSPACPGVLQGAIQSRSLCDWLTRARTRFLQQAQRPHQGPLSPPQPPGQNHCQLPALPRPFWAGADPRACPSRSMSSCWDQPGHIPAFEVLVSREESRFESSSPSGCPQSTLPCHGLWALWGAFSTYGPPWEVAESWADRGLLGLRENFICQGC